VANKPDLGKAREPVQEGAATLGSERGQDMAAGTGLRVTSRVWTREAPADMTGKFTEKKSS
jgi:hypothetical protein